jgi:DNA-binding response OmpR family regulator
MRVLVVEDDPGIRSLTLAVVRRGGFEAGSVTNGVDAIEALARGNFAAVVLDLLLPNRSGYDVLEWLQDNDPSLLSRVIILSATSPTIVRKQAVTHRVFRIMQKPFDIEELIEVLGACVDPFVAVGMKSTEAKADAAVIGVIAHDPDALRLIWSYGIDDETVMKYNPLPLDTKTPLGTSVVEARPVWVRSRDQLAAEYPSLEPSVPVGAVAAIPIVDHGKVAGSIGFRFTEEQPFDDGQQQLLLSIAAGCLPLAKTTG